MARQITDTILMVRPAHFGYNEETASNNTFQSRDTSQSAAEIQALALQEFEGFVGKLRAVGVEIIVIDDTDEPVKPDAVFPNNWITFHESGMVITYPIFSKIRRNERREDIVATLQKEYAVTKRVFFEENEPKGKYLEGTGSMIMDRPNQLVYACLSVRTAQYMIDKLAAQLDFTAVTFTAVDKDGIPIYHTNVMMALGKTFVVICLECIPDEQERQLLLDWFAKTKKEVIEITYEQLLHFAGNMLQVATKHEEDYLVMSAAAYHSLTTAQITAIEQHTSILYAAIPTIEKYGGGSVRCMMAEVFLPSRNS
ncbi:MAG: arginine deiminase-related protein [Bacteroidota bacterium]